jgi:hypothetical protein
MENSRYVFRKTEFGIWLFISNALIHTCDTYILNLLRMTSLFRKNYDSQCLLAGINALLLSPRTPYAVPPKGQTADGDALSGETVAWPNSPNRPKKPGRVSILLRSLYCEARLQK